MKLEKDSSEVEKAGLATGVVDAILGAHTRDMFKRIGELIAGSIISNHGN